MARYEYTSRSNYNTYPNMEQSNHGYGNPDHVRRPVIVDVESRKRPVISYNGPNNSEGYVTKIERIVEHVYMPHVIETEYKYSSPTYVDETEYKYSSPTYVEPVKDYGGVYDKLRRPSSPIGDRPERVEEFITQVQTEVSRPSRTSFLGNTNWGNNPNSTGHSGSTGYRTESYSNFSNDGRNKPSGNTIRDDRYDDYYRIKETPMEAKRWTTPPSHDANLSRATNNIDEAVELLKEAAIGSAVKTVSPQARFMLPSSIAPKRETYTDTIDSKEPARRHRSYSDTNDSKEAARRYGNLTSRPFKAVETYTGTIDSSEAARR